MVEPDLLAVLAATLVSFVIGALWFAPNAFGQRWLESRPAIPQATEAADPSRNRRAEVGRLLICTLAFCLLQSAALGALVRLVQTESRFTVLGLGLLTGIGLIVPSAGLIGQATRQRAETFWIESGYHLARTTACAGTLALCS
ncbi:MAG: DUF1761 domain-containing protein [Planctomycetota bacterium]